MGSQRKIIPSTTFYNSIAKNYDGYLQVEGDNMIRTIVEKNLKERVQSGTILDFGGGTGLDLSWLLNSYKVYFFEPAEKMRDIAKNRYSGNALDDIHFADEWMDFTQWSSGALPFSDKVDGVLANFAVLNCIEDISLVFDKIALLAKPNAYLFATVLDASFSNIVKIYSVKTALASLFRKTKITSNYNGAGHTTYLHSLAEYKQYANQNFDFVSYSHLGISNFSLLVLRKK